MNSKNISKKNSIFSKLGFGLGFGWVQTIAVLVVMGMVLSCGSDNATTPDTNPDTNPDTTPDFFTISYPNMDSAVSDTSVPVIVSGKNCDLRALTDEGSATYSVELIDNAGLSFSPFPLFIDSTTGVVKNHRIGTGGNIEKTHPSAYRVTVEVTGNPECKTDVIGYNTITPADKNALINYLFGGDRGVDINTGNLNYIDTSKLTDFSALFEGKNSFNGDISGWDTSMVEDMSSMFARAPSFNQPIGGWDTSKVKDMNNMFWNARAFNQPVGGWDTSQVTNMAAMFVSAGNFNRPLSNWNTSKVQNMSGMFLSADTFNQPIGGWNTAQVENMNRMFNSAFAFNRPLSNWNTAQVQDMTSMFDTAQKFNQDLSGWTVDKVTKYKDVFSRSPMATLTNQHPKAWQ